MNKKRVLSFILILSIFIMLPLALAHEEEMMGDSEYEDMGLGHQFEEIFPFAHFGEEHTFAGITLIILWISFIYTVYNLSKNFTKKKKR